MNPPDPSPQPHAQSLGQVQAMAWLAEVFQSEHARKLEVFALGQCSRHGIPNDAMDVLHDTFVDVLEGLGDGRFRYEGRKKLVNLLYTNMNFRIQNLAKAMRREQPHDPADLIEMETPSGSPADALPLIGEYIELIKKLPPAQQELKTKQVLRELFPDAGVHFSRRDFEQLKLAAERLRYLRDYMKPPTND